MIRYILIAFLAWGLVACYEDLGNYDYHDINELTVDSVKTIYTVDQLDTLKITPKLTGTMYNDTARFSYVWEIGGKVVGKGALLRYKVVESPGEKYCRFIIEDKSSGIKEYRYFRTNVVSSTAADGILLLSDYKGHSELSFKRIDQEDAPFRVNFYYDMNETYLGAMPEKISQLFSYETAGDGEIFGLHILSRKEMKRISHRTLMEDTVYPVYNKGYLKSILPANPANPDFGNMEVGNMSADVSSWFFIFGSPLSMGALETFIADGKYFMVSQTSSAGGTSGYSYLRGSELGGELSPVFFSVSKTKSWAFDWASADIGYNISNYSVLFDKTHRRFLYGGNSGLAAFKAIPELSGLDLGSYEPVFGSPTRNVNNPIVVLSDGNNFRCIVLQAPRDAKDYAEGQTTGTKFKVIGDYTIPAGQMDQHSDFYCYVTDEYLYFSTGGTLYTANLQAMLNGSWDTRPVCRLSEFGYDGNATINCFDFARSGKHVVLGIARDGKQHGTTSDELNGDVLLLGIDKATNMVTLKRKFEQVGGTPSDITLKYLNYFCEGYDSNQVFRDNL